MNLKQKWLQDKLKDSTTLLKIKTERFRLYKISALRVKMQEDNSRILMIS